jgi:hypothetical protein
MSGPGGRSAVLDGRLAGQVGPGPGEVLSISYMEGTFVVSGLGKTGPPQCTARGGCQCRQPGWTATSREGPGGVLTSWARGYSTSEGVHPTVSSGR